MWQIACFNLTSASDEADIFGGYCLQGNIGKKIPLKQLVQEHRRLKVQMERAFFAKRKLEFTSVHQVGERSFYLFFVRENKNLFIAKVFQFTDAVGQWNSKKYWKRTFNTLVYIGSHRYGIFSFWFFLRMFLGGDSRTCMKLFFFPQNAQVR